MIHPATELKFVNEEIGYGVFATAFIPKGTIVYVQCLLDIVIDPQSSLAQDPRYRDKVKKYSFTDRHGNWIVCWDIAKYINHCCNCNTLSTGYGFEITLRDIQAGEELTDDYGTFSFEGEMPLGCHFENCRRILKADDIDTCHSYWDTLIKNALEEFQNVPQPMLPFLDEETLSALQVYLSTGQEFKSILTMKYEPDSSASAPPT